MEIYVSFCGRFLFFIFQSLESLLEILDWAESWHLPWRSEGPSSTIHVNFVVCDFLPSLLVGGHHSLISTAGFREKRIQTCVCHFFEALHSTVLWLVTKGCGSLHFGASSLGAIHVSFVGWMLRKMIRLFQRTWSCRRATWSNEETLFQNVRLHVV